MSGGAVEPLAGMAAGSGAAADGSGCDLCGAQTRTCPT
jgi:hypothetical protein